jgi:hypothetical protein
MTNLAGVVGLLLAAWRRWYGPPQPDPALLIRPPVQKFGKVSQAEIDALRAKAEQRRVIAMERYRTDRAAVHKE